MSKITIYSPPATAQIKACAVDFDLRRAPVPVHLVQYDKTIPILAVSLYKGSSPYTLPADAEVNVRMNKRKNLCVYNPALGCNESRDMVYVAVTPQMTTQDGTFEPILEVVINSGVAGTSPLQLVIRRNPVQEDAIEDTSEVKTLTELVSQAAASATAAAQSASAAAQDAGNAAASATAAAESDEHATATAQNIKDSLDQIASNAAAVSKLKEDTDALKDGKISKFYASSQGDTNLPDSDDGRIMDLKLYGKSEQKQYAGRNLWSGENLGSNWMGNGVTVNNGCVSSDFIPVSGAKTIYVGYSYDWYVGYSCYDSNKNLIDGSTLQINSSSTETEKAYEIRASTKKTPENTAYIKLMYSKHEQKPYVSVAEGAYEPYVGGIPSPNPEYPQEIKSVVKPVVKVIGKNLFDNINKSIDDDGWITTKIVYVPKGKYVYKRFVDASSNGEINTQLYALIDGLWKSISNNSTTSFDDGNITFIDGNWNMGWGTTSRVIFELKKGYYMRASNPSADVHLMLVAGDIEPTEYEECKETTATLPYTLNAIPVASGGNVTIDGQQYVADYVDVERGKLVRMCSLVDAKSFTWGYDRGWSGDGYYSYDAVISNAFWNGSRGYVKSSICEEKPRDKYSSALRNTIMVAGAGNNVEFVGVSQNSLQSWNEYINANEVDILYALKSPVEVDLTADEIAAFKSLVSNYPVTNVSTTSDQLDGYTVFNYPISLANGWNYVKQQLGDTRDYLYGIDLMTAEAYVNSEYAAALAEIEV